MQENEPAAIDAGWAGLERARNGSERAWRELFAQHSPPLLRMAALMTGSTDTARDIVQETFVRLVGAQVDPGRGTLRAYLSTIAYRLALKEITRAHRRSPSSASEPVSPDRTPLESSLDTEREREVARVVGKLSGHHRDVLVLRLHGGHSYEEIAEMTGVSVGTVKSRIFYAVKAARKELKKRGVI